MTIRQLQTRLEQVWIEPSTIANPQSVMFYWLQDLFQVYDNIKKTSLNQLDERDRIVELANKLSK